MEGERREKQPNYCLGILIELVGNILGYVLCRILVGKVFPLKVVGKRFGLTGINVKTSALGRLKSGPGSLSDAYLVTILHPAI